MVVAIAVGQGGINTLLIASQVVLSIVLPFVALPLIYLTSRKVVMRVPKPAILVESEFMTHADGKAEIETESEQMQAGLVVLEKETTMKATILETSQVMAVEAEEFVDYSNNRWLAATSYAIWCVIVVANAYAIVMLVVNQGVVN